MNSNPVSAVLVTKGDQSPLAINNRIDQLGVGQIGAFSAQNNLSLSTASNLALAREFYLAVGVDRNGDTVLDDAVRSAGQFIRMSEIEHITLRCYSPARPQIIDITDFTSQCETEYGLRIRFASQAAYKNYGFNTPSKYFAVTTGCCDNCADPCTSGDCNQLAFDMVNQINNDPDGLMVATFVDYTTDPNAWAEVAASGYAAWIADANNAGLCLGIRITSVPSKLSPFLNGINQKYDYPRFTKLDVSLVEGFECANGTVTETQTLIAQQGAGYDLQQMESDSAGNTAIGHGPYRQSAISGLPFENYASIVNPTGEYLQYIITYKTSASNGGSITSTTTNLECVVAIPCADTTTRTNFVTLMDTLTAGRFEQLLSDNAACPACNSANTVNSLNSTANDGDA